MLVLAGQNQTPDLAGAGAFEWLGGLANGGAGGGDVVYENEGAVLDEVSVDVGVEGEGASDVFDAVVFAGNVGLGRGGAGADEEILSEGET
jgi:hypothetical protein